MPHLKIIEYGNRIERKSGLIDVNSWKLKKAVFRAAFLYRSDRF